MKDKKKKQAKKLELDREVVSDLEVEDAATEIKGGGYSPGTRTGNT